MPITLQTKTFPFRSLSAPVFNFRCLLPVASCLLLLQVACFELPQLPADTVIIFRRRLSHINLLLALVNQSIRQQQQQQQQNWQSEREGEVAEREGWRRGAQREGRQVVLSASLPCQWASFAGRCCRRCCCCCCCCCRGQWPQDVVLQLQYACSILYAACQTSLRYL